MRLIGVLVLFLLLCVPTLAPAAGESAKPVVAIPDMDLQSVRYVDCRAPLNGDGRSWAHAYRTIADAVAAGACRIWVADGTYRGPIKLLPGTELFGGFEGINRPGGGEVTIKQRDWDRCTTVIDAGRRGSAVTIPAGGIPCIVDGFSITSGSGSEGGGIACKGAASIRNNFITGNSSRGAGGGIYCDTEERVEIYRNYIMHNRATGNGGGISIKGCGIDAKAMSSIYTNVINSNEAEDGGGIYAEDVDNISIASNTLCDNKAEQKNGGGISIRRSCTYVENNIICFNSSGISLAGCKSLALHNNCVSQNKEGDYLDEAKRGKDDINPSDPFGRKAPDTHCHLGSDSPCIGKSDESIPASLRPDIDMQPRISHSDIGADQYLSESEIPEPDPNKTAVSPQQIPDQGELLMRIERSEDGSSETIHY